MLHMQHVWVVTLEPVRKVSKWMVNSNENSMVNMVNMMQVNTQCTMAVVVSPPL